MSKILIIDDDINALKLLGYTLRKAGFEILVAQNGFEGIEKAQAHVPDLIVSDLMMPRMDGYEVTRRIRANPQTQHIPIIILTAKSQVNDKVAGFEAGANDYVTKPVMPAELIARIKAQLARPTTATPAKARARIITFLGVKGGVGLSTLMVNLGLALQQGGKKVVLVDFQSHGGTICQQLGQTSNNTLLSLLKKPTVSITADSLSRTLMNHKSGLVMMPPPHGVYARPQPVAPAQVQAILNIVDAIADYVLVDLGATPNQTATRAFKMCHQICIVTEPNILALDLTRRTLQYLTDVGLLSHKDGVVVVNRSRTGHSLTLEQLRDILKTVVWGIIPPAPELAYQAIQSKTPMLILQPQHITTQQIKKLVSVFG